jgi:hypothetical protein
MDSNKNCQRAVDLQQIMQLRLAAALISMYAVFNQEEKYKTFGGRRR